MRSEGGRNPGRNLFADLAFAEGTEAVVLAEGENAVAVFDNCGFFNQTNYSVIAPEMPAVLITDSIFYSFGGIDSKAARTELFANWACNHPLMNEKGFFVNRGQEMLAEYILFVPILPRVFLENGVKTVPGCEDLDCGNNLRWYDNYGKFHAVNNRIGGEFIGMTPLWNFTETGSVFFDGGMSWQGNPYVKRCTVYCDEVPALIILRDMIISAEGRIDGPWNIHVLDKETGEDIKNPGDLPVISSAIEKYSS